MPLTDDVCRAAAQVQHDLKRAAAGVKWVDPEKLHVTVKFLGETDESQVQGIVEAMQAAVEPQEPFAVQMKGVGAFPSARRPRVIWLGVAEGAEPLAGIASRLEDGLATLGFEREDRPFRAHVTFGRVRSPQRAGPLTAEIELLGPAEVGMMTCEGIVLMRSDLSRSGPTYTPLETVSLRR